MLSGLRVSYKLLMIYALDMVAVIFFAYSLLEEKYLAINFARNERIGLEYLISSREVLFAVLEPNLAAGDISQLDAALERLRTVDQRLGSRLDTETVIGPALETAQTIGRGGEVEPALERLRALMARVGDSSNLILDPDLNSYYTMSLVVIRLPALTDLLARLSGQLVLAANGQPLDSTRRTDLGLLEGHLAAVIQGIRTDLAAGLRGDPSGDLNRVLKDPFTLLLDDLDQVAIDLRAGVATGRFEPATVAVLQSGFAAAVRRGETAWTVAATQLDQFLQRRIDGFFFRMYRSFLSAAVLLGIILTLVLVVARRIAVPIARLADAADRVRVTGDYSVRVDWSGTDEIGRLAHSFNRMVEGLEAGDKAKRLVEELEQAKAQLIEKNEALEKASRLVLDSLGYARKIQDGLLPDSTCLAGMLAELHISWQPLQQVGGDYYWLHRFGNRALILLADCTGHGVPGAFMTVVVASALDRILLEQDVSLTPAAILARLDQVVRERLRQDRPDSASDDGLDAALCLWDRQACTVTFAGANMPLSVLSHGSLNTIRGDRLSLGYRTGKSGGPFTETVIPVSPGDCFYLFTDGMIDHVGGAPPRLFGRRRLGDVILATQGVSLDRQVARMEQAQAAYRGPQQRRDDMAIIAFRPL